MTTDLLQADTHKLRTAMVASQLRTSAVADPRVVAAMARVPRERFVRGDAALAYRDTAVALGQGRAANPPIATGRLLDAARLAPGERVLLIGAAGGYTAAVLAELGTAVTAVEVDGELVTHARAALAGSGVTLVEGPLPDGAPQHAPYDALFVDGAVEKLPDTLAAQVREGGRVVTGIVDRGVVRLAAGTRSAGGFALVDFADIDAVMLPGFATPRGFTF